MEKHKRLTRQTRFLRDAQPIRLGNLGVNLSRISSHLDDARLIKAMMIFIDESKWFCEWAGLDALQHGEIELASMLLTLQRQLGQWARHFDAIYADPVSRSNMSTIAKAWSERLLQQSGLLPPMSPSNN